MCIEMLQILGKKYPQLKDIRIEEVVYDNLYIAKCECEKIGEYIYCKKGRIHNIRPTRILLTNKIFEKKEEDILFIFIHECSHAITPQTERKVKNSYVRIDHSRQFYENFLELLLIAYNANKISYKYTDINELMKRDNRKENIKNDLKIHSKR